MEELIVRIQALLNRPISISDPKSQEVFTIGQYTFHYPHQTLQISDQTETLSHREAEILRLLCLHANDVLHRKPVLMGLWGDDSFSMPAVWMYSLPSFVKTKSRPLGSDCKSPGDRL